MEDSRLGAGGWPLASRIKAMQHRVIEICPPKSLMQLDGSFTLISLSLPKADAILSLHVLCLSLYFIYLSF